MRALKETGFDGTISIELEDVPGVARGQAEVPGVYKGNWDATDAFEEENRKAMAYIKDIAQQLAMPLVAVGGADEIMSPGPASDRKRSPGPGDIRKVPERGRQHVQEDFVVGVDLGTSGVRAIVFDRSLRSVAQASRSYGVNYAAGRRGGAARGRDHGGERRMHSGGRQACRASAAVSGRLRSAARPAAWRRSGRLRSRTAASCRLARPGCGPITGRRARRAASGSSSAQAPTSARAVPVHASYWPAKLLWWREHGYGPFAEDLPAPGAWRLGGPKDYLIYRLTGEWVTDRATAAATGLYDSQREAWDTELLDWLGVTPGWLPHVVPLTGQLALLPAVAQQLGLPATARVVAGGLDGVLVHLGMGCAREGLASCTIGTSSAVRMSSPRRVTDALGRTWCYPIVDDLWLAGGAGNNGGNVLTWFHALCTEMARFGGSQAAASRCDRRQAT